MSTGCEPPAPESIDRVAAQLERRAKRQFGGRQKTGMLRALEVSRSATQVAQAMAQRPEPACEMVVAQGRPFRYEFDLLLERRGPGRAGVSARWQETRRLRRAESGALELVMEAEFHTPAMRANDAPGRRALRWMIVDESAYLSDDRRAQLGSDEANEKEDAPEYYRRRANPGERAALQFAGLGTLQTLLDAPPEGWQRAPGAPPRWTPGAHRIRCMMPIRGLQNAKDMPMHSQAVEANWRQQFADIATLLDADFEVQRAPDISVKGDADSRQTVGDARRLTLDWRLQDGATLSVVFRDAWSESAETIEPPASRYIVDVERDRSLFEATRRLEKWRDAAWILPAPEVEMP